MHDFNVITTAIGALVLVLALGSRRLSASPIPPTLLALLVGVVLGPQLLDFIDPSEIGDRTTILELAARLTLGIALVGVALRLPREFPLQHWRSMAVLLGFGMPLMWLASTALVHLILDLPFWLSALIGAALTPTDPVAASAIVTSSLARRVVPDSVRHAISMESGLNDGLGYPFVFIAFLMMTLPAGEAIGRWLTHTLLWEVGMATLLGLAIGAAAGKLLTRFQSLNAVESDSRLAYTAALALLAIGLGRLIQTDEVLLVFGAGMGFDQVVSAKERDNEELGQEAVNRFFSIPVFALFGTTIPWDGWLELGWKGPLLIAAVLLLRRPPVLLLLRPAIPLLGRMPEALFVGWFGPIAVSALYYATLMERRLEEPIIWHVVSLLVFASVLVHGVSGGPLTRLYGRNAEDR